LKKNKNQEGESVLLSAPQWNRNGLCPIAVIENTLHATTFPSILKQNGYFTIHIGKKHFAAYNTAGESSLKLGFDINVANHAA
jgi:arylsulfatase A-like enzyme